MPGYFKIRMKKACCSGSDSLLVIRISGLLMKRCEVVYHDLVMPFEVNLDPAHGPNRAQNRCRDVRPNRIVEICDYPVVKPCTHAFSPISRAPLGRICRSLSAAKVRRGGKVSSPNAQSKRSQCRYIQPRVTKRQAAGWLFAYRRASRRPERVCATLSAEPLRLRGTSGLARTARGGRRSSLAGQFKLLARCLRRSHGRPWPVNGCP